jgi:hypothetical protein
LIAGTNQTTVKALILFKSDQFLGTYGAERNRTKSLSRDRATAAVCRRVLFKGYKRRSVSSCVMRDRSLHSLSLCGLYTNTVRSTAKRGEHSSAVQVIDSPIRVRSLPLELCSSSCPHPVLLHIHPSFKGSFQKQKCVWCARWVASNTPLHVKDVLRCRATRGLGGILFSYVSSRVVARISLDYLQKNKVYFFI